MNEYFTLKHMREATEIERNQDGYFIPYHAVWRGSKIRVVFDGSCATSNGTSINDIQYPGPNLQEHIAYVTMRFRFHKVVLASDVCKMYRQFLVHQDDQKYQKILWRSNKNEPIKEYVLTTVTYGMKSSPYLAVRTMIELAEIYKESHPNAARVTLKERYVDDYFTGGDNEQEVLQIYRELSNLLQLGGMELSKWQTNSTVVANLINDNLNTSEERVELKDEFSSVLGLNWLPSEDCFTFRVKASDEVTQTLTKRSIVAKIAQLYDPHGYLAPVVMVGKMFIQRLWKLKISWDEKLDNELSMEWNQYYSQLGDIQNVRIPRWLQTTAYRRIELIGFADASQLAMGAVIYVRITSDGYVWSNLLISRSKIAPVKTVSIPRLELCAAEMLADLMKQVRERCDLQ